MKYIFLTIALMLSTNALAEPTSFSGAKRILAKHVYTDSDLTFYCGCDMYYKEKKGKKKLTPSHDRCGFEPRKEEKRAARIEWEHVMPAWFFGHQMQCWQDGGRKACGKVKEFKKMESNLHNLVPAIGEVNGNRSNYDLTMLSGTYPKQYGQCNMTVDFKAKKAMPDPSVRGDVARTYFYMADKYNLRLSSQHIKLYKAWHKQDPVTKEELRIHNLKVKHQGEENPYVTGSKNALNYKN